MFHMPERSPCVKSQGKQLCLFAWADDLPTTIELSFEPPSHRSLILRLKRRTGWSEARCRATIEANGGWSHV